MIYGLNAVSTDETVQSVHVYGEDIEVAEKFTDHGSVVHNNGGSNKGSCAEDWPGPRHYGLTQHKYHLVLSVPE